MYLVSKSTTQIRVLKGGKKKKNLNTIGSKNLDALQSPFESFTFYI